MSPGGTESTAREAEPYSKTVGIENPSFDHLEHIVDKQLELLARFDNIYFDAGR